MQWLINLILEAIGGPPFFVDRGDVLLPDFSLANFTRDGAWHDLDLSAIVPAGAAAVALSVGIETDGVEDCFHLRKNGMVFAQNRAWLNTQVADSLFTCDVIVGIDTNRVLEYRAIAAVWDKIFVTVKGWWL